jgi:hypothetical protein
MANKTKQSNLPKQKEWEKTLEKVRPNYQFNTKINFWKKPLAEKWRVIIRKSDDKLFIERLIEDLNSKHARVQVKALNTFKKLNPSPYYEALRTEIVKLANSTDTTLSEEAKLTAKMVLGLKIE